MPSSRVWNALTNNYGNVMPVDWKTSYTRSLHLPALKLTEQEVPQTTPCVVLLYELVRADIP